MRKTAANDDLLTTRQVGELLGVAVRTVQLWVESGVLPAWRTAGGHRRISRDAVKRLLEERAQVTSAESTPSPALETRGPLQLLLVEDDPILRKLFIAVVEDWDIPLELRTATNGFEGLLRIGESRPDVVVTDLNMPGMDGFEMIRTLRRPGSGYENMVLIVASAFTASDIASRGGLPDGVPFFDKPINFTKLADLIRQHFPALAAAELPS